MTHGVWHQQLKLIKPFEDNPHPAYRGSQLNRYLLNLPNSGQPLQTWLAEADFTLKYSTIFNRCCLVFPSLIRMGGLVQEMLQSEQVASQEFRKMAISYVTFTAFLIIVAVSSIAGHPLPSSSSIERENDASLATRIFWPWTMRPSQDCTRAMAGPGCLAVDLWALGWVLLLTLCSVALLVLYHAALEYCLRVDLRQKVYWALRNSVCCGGCVRRTGCGKEYEYEEI